MNLITLHKVLKLVGDKMGASSAQIELDSASEKANVWFFDVGARKETKSHSVPLDGVLDCLVGILIEEE